MPRKNRHEFLCRILDFEGSVMLDCGTSLTQLVCAAILYSFDSCAFRDVFARQATLMLLVRFVRSDRKMKARLGKVIFDISVWVAVIVSGRGGLQELSGEESGVAKTKVQPFIHLVFGNQIEFASDVAAGAGVAGNRNRSAAGVKVVIRSGQPVALKGLLEFPFLADVFLHADPELHKISAAHLIGETVLVVIRRIELVKGIPVSARRIFRSRGVVALDKDPRRCSNVGKRLAHAGIARPCADGRCAKRTFLSVKLGVVVEPRGESTLHVQADGDCVEMAAANRFWKSKVPGRKAPENIRFEGGPGNDVLEASVDSVEVVSGNRAV